MRCQNITYQKRNAISQQRRSPDWVREKGKRDCGGCRPQCLLLGQQITGKSCQACSSIVLSPALAFHFLPCFSGKYVSVGNGCDDNKILSKSMLLFCQLYPLPELKTHATFPCCLTFSRPARAKREILVALCANQKSGMFKTREDGTVAVSVNSGCQGTTRFWACKPHAEGSRQWWPVS